VEGAQIGMLELKCDTVPNEKINCDVLPSLYTTLHAHRIQSYSFCSPNFRDVWWHIFV